MTQGVYQIRCTSTSKGYVGSALHIEKRWAVHRHHLRKGSHTNTHLQRAWNKYGEENFTFEILEQVALREDLLPREKFWIAKKKSFTNGFNLTPEAVSGLGRVWTPEQKRKHSEVAKKVAQRPGESRRRSRRARAQHREGKLGIRTCSPETLRLMRKKISKTLTGRRLSEDHRRSLSVAQLKRYRRPGERRKRREAAVRGHLNRKLKRRYP